MRSASLLVASSLLLGSCCSLAPHAVFAQEALAKPPAPTYVIPPQMGLELQVVPTVSKVVPGSPGEKAGFRVNDRLLRLDGKALDDSTSFVKTVAALPERQVVAVTLLRRGMETTIRATLDDHTGPAPAPVDGKPAPPRGRLGLAVENLLIVSTLTPGGLAEKAGLQRGDRIEEVNHHTVDTVAAATRKLAGAVYRGQAELKLRRNELTPQVTLSLGAPVPYVVTREDDQTAVKHFRSLPSFYKEVVDDPTGSSEKYIGDTMFLAARVLDFVMDVPKAGQAVYVFSTPGDFMKDGQRKGAVYTVWQDKNQISRFKVGDAVFFRAQLDRIRLEENGEPLHLIFAGEEAFASPGGAFNPTRPLLRTSGPTPEGALRISDVVKQIHENAAAVQTRLKGKTMVYEGVVRQLTRVGKDHVISFYPNGVVEPVVGKSLSTITVYVHGDLGGALKGFKKGETLRFQAVLNQASLETKEVDNFLDGGKTKETALFLLLDGRSFILDEDPL